MVGSTRILGIVRGQSRLRDAVYVCAQVATEGASASVDVRRPGREVCFGARAARGRRGGVVPRCRTWLRKRLTSCAGGESGAGPGVRPGSELTAWGGQRGLWRGAGVGRIGAAQRAAEQVEQLVALDARKPPLAAPRPLAGRVVRVSRARRWVKLREICTSSKGVRCVSSFGDLIRDACEPGGER